MARRFYDLPSLTTLAVFEASARHLSLKEAASELSVTPGAVTRQIKALEEELGSSLFNRIHRGVELTDEGALLYSVLSQNFNEISNTIRQIRHKRSPVDVTIAASTAVATMWLMPRIGEFWRSFPDITVNHLISDDPVDFLRPELDLRIRYGDGSWPGETSQLLFRDEIFPVAGPDFPQDRVAIEEIPNLPLLRLESGGNRWPTWEDWFRATGLDERLVSGRRFNNYVIVLQAAQDNQGVALGWQMLIQPLLDQGKLKRLTDTGIETKSGYYLTWRDDRPLSDEAETIRAWLLDHYLS
ncbi:LysR substrate-binding domain-containing protein [Coralliovum pocilloporae]|uniref:LysR substrate-binding domain-containing protein n=1 Tax=Coralliovum pocilloporae TaxID=3066369 RepID=UPI00330755C7